MHRFEEQRGSTLFERRLEKMQGIVWQVAF
jgi:hypothetical protein